MKLERAPFPPFAMFVQKRKTGSAARWLRQDVS
jgi:hypothetical protein